MTTILIRDAQVILPSGIAETHVLIRDGVIAAIDAGRTSAADEVIDAAGLVLMPGVVDDQVHFRDPGLEHKEDLRTGSQACAAGGVTTFLEMPNTKPSAVTVELIENKYRIAESKCVVNRGFYIGASCTNVDQLRQAQNVPGIKIFIGSSTGDLLVDEQDALERIFAETTLPICAHCEDETTVRENAARIGTPTSVADHSRIRDVNAAVVATRRSIDLAQRHKHRFHVLHVSTAAELEYIKNARPWITAEACPHHLFFSVDDYPRLGTLVQMNPSLKSKSDCQQLWAALHENVIQVIATDHAPHTLEEKRAEYPKSPSGLPAVENSLALMLDQASRGAVTLSEIAHWMCDAPARVWGLVGKGRISVGYDADLVLVDLSQRRTIVGSEQFTKSKWSPWEGETLTGWPVRTIVGGQTVFLNGQLQVERAGGRVRCDHSRGGYWSTPDGIGPA